MGGKFDGWLSARYTQRTPAVDLPSIDDRNRRMSLPAVRPKLIAVLLAAAMVVAGCNRGPTPLPAETLQIRINLLCTTCDDFLRCTRAEDASRGDLYRIYRLREKSFWAQIATIWDYLVQWIHRKTTDTRPLTVYLNDGDQRRVLNEEAQARVDAVAGLISLPDSSIDMRDGHWRDPQGATIGQCVTLPRREGYAWVRMLLGRQLPEAATISRSEGAAQ